MSGSSVPLNLHYRHGGAEAAGAVVPLVFEAGCSASRSFAEHSSDMGGGAVREEPQRRRKSGWSCNSCNSDVVEEVEMVEEVVEEVEMVKLFAFTAADAATYPSCVEGSCGSHTPDLVFSEAFDWS